MGKGGGGRKINGFKYESQQIIPEVVGREPALRILGS